MTSTQQFDVVVVGGGPSGATAADLLAKAGKAVLLLDKAGRIKPCGGAIPPRLIQDFEIPDALLCARIRAARMVSPTDKRVDMPVDGGFVGMVNREDFDEFLRTRAAEHGAVRQRGSYQRITRDEAGTHVHFTDGEGAERSVVTRLVIGADGALSQVAKQEVNAKGAKVVFAYHEIVEAPKQQPGFDGARCDVVYDGRISPDFYGWVFPHGNTVSIGSGSAVKGFSLRKSVTELRSRAGMADAKLVRGEGAPIPMKPLSRWDNGKDVVLAGDAAGVVAPASGEGIYYAMVGGEFAAQAALTCLETGKASALKLARKQFMKKHGRVFWILGVMQYFWYSSDKRREKFVHICKDPDVQYLTWQSYMTKELVKQRPSSHVRIFFKDLAHLFGFGQT